MQRRLDRSASKRGLDARDGDDRLPPEPKRPRVPALASVIVEALKMDSLQKLCSSLEPILRRVVSEEVERALAKLGPPMLQGRSSPKRLEGPDGRNLQLHFRTRLSLPLFTGGKVEGEQGAAIHVVLLDVNTGHVVTSGPESFAKLEVLVLEGDFNKEDEEDWTEEEFDRHVVKEREGKRPLLTGDLHVTLKEGVGTLGELIFTDNSSWIRSRKFRLGLKVSSGFCEGVRVREAKTEAFLVKDHRGELYKKHYPPALKDEVWRLEKIGKDGAFHKKLNAAGITTVEEFLRLLVRDHQKLRSILGSGMSTKMWEVLVEHAKTCVLSGKHYVYYSDDARNVGAIFNNMYEFTGLIADGQFYSAESLTESQRLFADELLKKAYDNWGQVLEYDGKALLGFKQKKKNAVTRSEPSTTSSSYHASADTLPAGGEDMLLGNLSSEGEGNGSSYAGNRSGWLSSSSTVPPMNAPIHFTPYVAENHFNGALASSQSQLVDNCSMAALRSLQPGNLDFQSTSQSVQPTPGSGAYYDWPHQLESVGVDDNLMDEIRLRSNEMLGGDDMQQLLRVLTAGGAATNMADDVYGFTSYMPSPSQISTEDDRSRSSGRAVVGWLKIKAAMRWGIFIRKQAAEKRRAQIVELDD